MYTLNYSYMVTCMVMLFAIDLFCCFSSQRHCHCQVHTEMEQTFYTNEWEACMHTEDKMSMLCVFFVYVCVFFVIIILFLYILCTFILFVHFLTFIIFSFFFRPLPHRHLRHLVITTPKINKQASGHVMQLYNHVCAGILVVLTSFDLGIWLSLLIFWTSNSFARRSPRLSISSSFALPIHVSCAVSSTR